MTAGNDLVYAPEISERVKLAVKDLRVYFPLRRKLLDVLRGAPRPFVRAVDGLSFEVFEGEVFSLVGESGCGKTTTGKTVLRLIKPYSGSILYKPGAAVNHNRLRPETEYGHIDLAKYDEKELKPLRRDLQICWQDPFSSINPRKTIFKILEEPLLIHRIGSTRGERYEIIAKALEMVKLVPPEEYMRAYPHMLSGGQRQRVVIARALILNPSFLVADEPVSMLDASVRAEILSLMLELKEKYNLTYLFITHDLAVARYISSRIGVMYLGKMVEMGNAQKVLSDPLHPYTQALIEAIPEPEPERRLTVRELPIKGEVPSAVTLPEGCRFHPRCVVCESNPALAEKCRTQEPPLIKVEGDRYVACWLAARQ
ncbi:MAG: ABC transporter ATP-binding protein [Thermofilaceae archaeon]